MVLVLTDSQRSIFTKIVASVSGMSEIIPLQFMLGFYVSLVIGVSINKSINY